MKKTLRRIWEDIIRGENIDTYISLVLAFLLPVLEFFGIVPQDYIPTLTLAILALITTNSIGDRHRIEDLNKRCTSTTRDPLSEKWPYEEIKMDLEKAKEIWLIGVNLGHTVREHLHAIEKIINKKGGKIKVLLVDADECVIRIVRYRFYSTVERSTESLVQTLNDTHRTLCNLGRLSDNLEVRTIKFPVAYGAIVVNPSEKDARIYMKYYCFQIEPEPKPYLILSAKHEHRWFIFFKREIEKLWEEGERWGCPK